MKTTKRFFIALLAAFSVIVGNAQILYPKGTEDFAYGDFGYVWASETENVVLVCNSQKRAVSTITELEIPEKTYCESEGVECVVVGVCAGAFANLVNLEKVVLPATVEEIGDEAFTRRSSTDDGSTYYSGLSKLKAINLENVKRIGANAFRASGFSSVTLPVTLERIGATAFADCTSLEMLNLETSAIAANMFSGCENLVHVEFGTAVTEISDGLFANTGIAEVVLPSTLVRIGVRAFQGTKIKTITIPAAVTEIKALAFDGCSNLLNVNFESSPKIAETAFPSSASLNLTIKDKETFYNENPNIFDKITYVREFSSESYASLILPFVPDQLDQMEVFQMVAKNDDCLIFKAVEDFVPGTPYMVKLNKEEGESSKLLTELTGTEVEVALSNQNYESKAGDWKMIGQYERIVLKADSCYDAGYRNYYYATAKNEFLYSEGKLAVSPFRAYIQAPKEETARVRMMIRGNDGVDTEIDMVELEDVFAPAVDAYYDLNGSRVVAPIEGQMYIVNGKKIVF